MPQELGIIRSINAGMRDCNKPVVWFDVELLFGNSLQIEEDIDKFIQNVNCYRLSDLVGKPCIVNVSDNVVTFLHMKD